MNNGKLILNNKTMESLISSNTKYKNNTFNYSYPTSIELCNVPANLFTLLEKNNFFNCQWFINLFYHLNEFICHNIEWLNYLPIDKMFKNGKKTNVFTNLTYLLFDGSIHNYRTSNALCNVTKFCDSYLVSYNQRLTKPQTMMKFVCKIEIGMCFLVYFGFRILCVYLCCGRI